MPAWTHDELARIDAQDEVRVAGRKADGSLRRSVIVWSVRHGDDLYVRSAYGRDAAWFRGVQVCHEGRLDCDGLGKDVTFEEVDGDFQSSLDAAYRDKYEKYPRSYVDAVVSAPARAATLRVIPTA